MSKRFGKRMCNQTKRCSYCGKIMRLEKKNKIVMKDGKPKVVGKELVRVCKNVKCRSK